MRRVRSRGCRSTRRTASAAASGARRSRRSTASAAARRPGCARRPAARVDLLIGALAAALPADDSPVVLVLDDFHEVADTVHADLERLLRTRCRDSGS